MQAKKFSTDFKNAIEQFSKSTGVEAETILEAVFMKYLAEGNARQKVFGPHNSICTELAKDGNGKFLKGRELYQALEKIAVDKLTQERRAALVARKKSTLTTAEREWLADHPKTAPAKAKINREVYHKAGAERALILQKIEKEKGKDAAQKWADEHPFAVKRYTTK